MSSWIDLTTFISTFTILFVIMDPPGNVPVFLALTSKADSWAQKRAAFQATLTSFSVIVVFALFGQYILNLLQISVEALRLSGGVLLFLVAMELLTGKDQQEPDATGDYSVNVALVPLGTPLLAGPGTIVAVMVAVANAHGNFAATTGVALAVVVMHLVLWVSLYFAVALSGVLGEGGTLLLTRIAGLLLAAIATQMVASSIFDFIATNKHIILG